MKIKNKLVISTLALSVSSILAVATAPNKTLNLHAAAPVVEGVDDMPMTYENGGKQRTGKSFSQTGVYQSTSTAKIGDYSDALVATDDVSKAVKQTGAKITLSQSGLYDLGDVDLSTKKGDDENPIIGVIPSLKFVGPSIADNVKLPFNGLYYTFTSKVNPNKNFTIAIKENSFAKVPVVGIGVDNQVDTSASTLRGLYIAGCTGEDNTSWAGSYLYASITSKYRPGMQYLRFDGSYPDVNEVSGTSIGTGALRCQSIYNGNTYSETYAKTTWGDSVVRYSTPYNIYYDYETSRFYIDTSRNGYNHSQIKKHAITYKKGEKTYNRYLLDDPTLTKDEASKYYDRKTAWVPFTEEEAKSVNVTFFVDWNSSYTGSSTDIMMTSFNSVALNATNSSTALTLGEAHKISFDPDGGSKLLDREYGANVNTVEPTAPTKKGFRFDGWYNGDEKYTFGGKLTSDVSLKAKWVKTYSVKFGADATATVLDENSEISAPAQDPTKEADAQYTYTFDGWYNGETKFVAGTKATADVTYTAKFIGVVNKYTIKFGEEDTGSEIEYGTVITPPADPTKQPTVDKVYTFDGWYDGETKLEATTTVSKDVTYVAKFNESTRKYTVKFGEEDTGSEVEYGADITAPTETPTKQADAQYTYTFDGWYVGDVKLAEGDKVSGDVTYEARFTSTVNKYTVKFGSNDQGTQLDYGTEIAAPANNPTQEPTVDKVYTFDGWYANDVKLEAGATVSGDVTYEARFNESTRQYIVKFGSDVQGTLVDYGADIEAPAENPTKPEDANFTYEFDGWYVGDVKLAAGDKVSGDVTYEARFTATQKQQQEESSSSSSSQEQSSSESSPQEQSSSESSSQEQSSSESSSQEQSSSSKEESSSKKEESSSKQESSKVEESSKVDSSSSSEEPSNPFGCKGSASAGLLTLGGLLATMFALKKRKNSK